MKASVILLSSDCIRKTWLLSSNFEQPDCSVYQVLYQIAEYSRCPVYQVLHQVAEDLDTNKKKNTGQT